MESAISADAPIGEEADRNPSVEGKRASVARSRYPLARIRLVLADGHPILLQGLQHLFRRELDFQILACCTGEEETLCAVGRHQPAILVLDLHLPGRGGLALLRDLAVQRLPTRVVLLTASITEDEIVEALRLGVKGVVLKEMAPGLLVKCIRRVNEGAMWLENGSASGVVERMVRRETNLHELKHTLTRRELQVLQLAASGLRNKDITTSLNITEGTVKIHLHNIYTKLGLKDRLDLIFCAREKALV